MNHLRLSVAVLFSFLAACAPRGERLQGDDLVVLEGATLIDGTGASPRQDSVVVLRGERIWKVGQRGDYSYPGATTVTDLSGRWLLPGFMDLHAHVGTGYQEEGVPPDEMKAKVLRTLLAFGITTIRSPAAQPDAGPELRDRIASGEVLGPRMFVAGPLMDLPGGMWGGWGGHVGVETVEDVRAEIRRQADAGVDFVKLYSRLSPEMVRAGIEEAQSLGVPVLGHLGEVGWADAARWGIDGLVHSGVLTPGWELVPPNERARFRKFYLPLPEFDPELFGPWRQRVDLDGPEITALVSALAENGVEVNANLIATEAIYWGGDFNYLESQEPDYAPTSQAEIWRQRTVPISSDWSADAIAEARASFPLVQEIVRRFHDGGVLVTAGSDIENPWITPGVSLHNELRLLHDTGISTLDVLRIATRNGAEALGILEDVGTIEAGKRADLIVLTDDPVADISNTRTIESVFLGGRRLEPTLLTEQTGGERSN